MTKWQQLKLGEIATFVNGYAFKPSDWNDTGIPIIRIQNLTNDNASRNYYNGQLDEKYRVVRGDILISWSATIGVFEWTREDSYLNQHIFKVVFNKLKVNKSFFKYLIKQKINEMLAKVHGSTMKHITKSNFDNIPILLPDIKEQDRIARILDKAEEIRTKKKLANKKLDEFLKSTFIDMFGDPVINSNKYKVHKLEKYIKVIGGYAFKSKLFKEDGIPVLRIGNINTGILKLDNVVYWDYDETLQKYMLYPNDLVISLTGTVGKDDYGNVCILPKTCNCYYLNQRNAKLDVNKEMDKYYLCYLLRNKDIKSRLTGISRGVRQANIANSDILNLLVPIPPIDLQKQFAPIVQKVEAQKEKNQKVIEQMDNLFNSLMQQAFNSSL